MVVTVGGAVKGVEHRELASRCHLIDPATSPITRLASSESGCAIEVAVRPLYQGYGIPKAASTARKRVEDCQLARGRHLVDHARFCKLSVGGRAIEVPIGTLD